MKPLRFLLPLAALAINVAVMHRLGKQEESARNERDGLRRALASLPAPVAGTGGGMAAERGISEDPDLGAVARSMTLESLGIGEPDSRAMLILEWTVLHASDNDLLNLMEQALSLDMPGEVRSILMIRLAKGLDDGDPETVVRLFSRLEGRALDSLRRSAATLKAFVYRWAERDPAAVRRWIDEQAASGFFDSRELRASDPFRNGIEAIAVAGLLPVDRDGVYDRLNAMSDHDRMEVFSEGQWVGPAAESRRAWAAAVRDWVPEDRREPAWGSLVIGAMKDGTVDDAVQLMDDVSASPGERRDIATLAAAKAISRLTPATVENTAALRAWLADRVPDRAAEALGRALAKSQGWVGDVSDLVEALHAAGPSDAMVLSFIRNDPQHRGGRSLANAIVDPVMRRMAFEELELDP